MPGIEVKVGSRESRLAVVQSMMLVDYIRRTQPGADVQLVTMKTTGDVVLDKALDKVGGKGLFVKELDRALTDGRTDLSVHSLKDVPMVMPKPLPLLGFSRREDPRDALVLPLGAAEWDMAKPLGCSSKRRIVQLKRRYPQLEIRLIRGNVQTRLRKLDDGQYGATILAAAGLKRLGLEHRISRYFEVDELLPAAGQGILAVQGRAGEPHAYLDGFFDAEATRCALAERAFVRELDGGCSSPIAAHATVNGDTLTLTGLYYETDSDDYRLDKISGAASRAAELGVELAQRMRAGDLEWQ